MSKVWVDLAGIVLTLSGLSMVVYGVGLIYPPACWLVAGTFVFTSGQKVAGGALDD